MSSERTTGDPEPSKVQGVQPPLARPIDETAAFDAAMARQTQTMGGAAAGDQQAPPELPTSFGRYRIQSQLGLGGMGSVYLARDTQLERDVALKVPRLANDETGTLVERFLREARAAATLSHPNICPIFDVGQESGTHFIAMGYIEGRPLTAYIESGKRQPERQVAIVVRKIALALQEAHARGIVHRDLKPANIMIDRRGEPIVMDFGLACRVDDRSTRLTQDGILVGTPAYMSPEQIDQRAPVGPPADVYSLGVLLYELLTGTCPFSGSVVSVIGQVLHSEPKPVAELRPDVSESMAEICRKAMAKQPDERFPSMRDMALALTDLLKQEGGASAILKKVPAAAPIVAEPLPKAERLEELLEESAPVSIMLRGPAVAPVAKSHVALKRRQPWMAIVLGVAGMLLLGVILTIVLTRSSDDSPNTAPQSIATTTAPAAPAEVASPTQKPAKPAEIDLETISSLPTPVEVKSHLPAEPATKSEPPINPPVAPTSQSPAPLEPAPAPVATAAAVTAPAEVSTKPEPPATEKFSGLDFPPGQHAPETKDQPSKEDLAAKFRQNDRNGDGKLDPGEVPMHIILRADKNRDHALSLTEIEAAYKRLGSKLFDPPTAAEKRRIPRPPDGNQGPGPGGPSGQGPGGPGGQGPGGPNRPRPPRR